MIQSKHLVLKYRTVQHQIQVPFGGASVDSLGVRQHLTLSITVNLPTF